MASVCGSHGDQSVHPSPEAYNAEMLRRAELEAELSVRRANIKQLRQDVGALAEEVEMNILVERWGQLFRSDDEERLNPEIRAVSLCCEMASKPEALDDVLLKLQYQKAKLHSDVEEVMSELKRYKVVE